MREIAAIRELFDTRLDAMDKAIILLQAARDHSASINVVEQMVKALKELHEEKFSSIETQFVERDTRTEQMALATKIAVDAALQAAKEAVGEQNRSSAQAIMKSETATIKQIDQIGVLLQTTEKAIADKFAQQTTLFQTSQKATDDKFGEMKDRMAETAARITTIEGRAAGGAVAVTRMGEGWGVVMGVVGAAIGVGGIVAAVAIAIMRSR